MTNDNRGTANTIRLVKELFNSSNDKPLEFFRLNLIDCKKTPPTQVITSALCYIRQPRTDRYSDVATWYKESQRMGLIPVSCFPSFSEFKVRNTDTTSILDIRLVPEYLVEDAIKKQIHRPLNKTKQNFVREECYSYLAILIKFLSFCLAKPRTTNFYLNTETIDTHMGIECYITDWGVGDAVDATLYNRHFSITPEGIYTDSHLILEELYEFDSMLRLELTKALNLSQEDAHGVRLAELLRLWVGEEYRRGNLQ